MEQFDETYALRESIKESIECCKEMLKYESDLDDRHKLWADIYKLKDLLLVEFEVMSDKK